MSEQVVTVSPLGEDVGSMDKLRAHRLGVAHRAVSVMLSNGRGQVLLQRRSLSKYHCGGLWSNTCCGHPLPGETTAEAAQRRLGDEVGIRCQLTEVGTFRYRCEVTDGLVENELVHLFVGRFEGSAIPNREEVAEVRWVDIEALGVGFIEEPCTPWFRMYIRTLPDFVAGRIPALIAPLAALAE